MRAITHDVDLAYRRRWVTLPVLCVSLFVLVLDNTILNVALPTLARPKATGGLSASASQLQWIVDSYTVVFAGLLLTAGSLGDRFGRYRALVFGLVVFGTGSVISSTASSANALILARSIMGAGGAFIMPSTLSILSNVFLDPIERRKAIGLWSGVAGLAALGPITGGLLLAHFWWGSVFLINIPIVIGGLIAGYFLIPESRDPSTPKLDPVGALLSIAGLSTVLWGVIEAPNHGWTATPTLVAFGVGTSVLVAFVAWELTYESPMLNLRFFRNPRFSAASGAIGLTFFTMFGNMFVMTQYLQVVLDLSALQAGLILGPQALTMMIFAPLSPRWVGRFGNKFVVASGLAISAASMVLITQLSPDSPAWAVIGITFVQGMGLANIMAPATDSIMGALPRAKAGVGSAVNDTTRQVGGAFGVAVVGSLLASRYSAEIRDLLGHVPAVPPLVRNNVGAAHGFAVSQLRDSPELAQQVIDASNRAFMTGLRTTAALSALLLFAAAGAVLRFLPSRPVDADASAVPHDAGAPADVGG